MITSQETLLDRNLKSVFGERDPERRATAIAAIYTEDCVFFEADGEVRGHSALSARVQGLLDGAPGFVFTVIDGPDIIQDMERMTWTLGPSGAQAVATGTDIALISNGRIRLLYTFVADPAR